MLTESQVIIFLGPPGSGKGTQAGRLSSALQIPAISTGDMLRRECNSGSALGNAVKNVLASGRLVSDDLINEVVNSRLRYSDCDAGCILDGYPRTLSQARYLDGLLSSLNKRRPVVFDFEISTDEIVRRLSCRRQCVQCGRTVSVSAGCNDGELLCDRDGSALIQRTDDNPASIRQRLRLYERNARQLVRYYRDQDYHRVMAARPADEVCDELLNLLAGSWSTPVLRRTATVLSHSTVSA